MAVPSVFISLALVTLSPDDACAPAVSQLAGSGFAISKTIESISKTRNPRELSQGTDQILKSNDSDAILKFAEELSALNYRDYFLPDPAMIIFLSYSKIVNFALTFDTLKFETSIATLRQKISWYYFGLMLNAPTTNDALDYHSFMEETARVGLRFQAAVNELKRLQAGIEAPIQE